MLLSAGALVVLIAVAVILKLRVPGGVDPGALGWMSDQWLTEHSASRSP